MKTARLKRDHAQGTGTRIRRGRLLGIAGLLMLALAADAQAQVGTATIFDTPAAYVKAASAQDYDVTSNVAPLGAKHAKVEIADKSSKTTVEATANKNGRKGFRALAQVKSPSSREIAPGGEANVAMDFMTKDPLGRERVKVVVDVEAIASAGLPVLDDPVDPGMYPSGAFFDFEVGAFATFGRIDRDPDGTEHVTMPSAGSPGGVGPPLLKVTGVHARNIDNLQVGFNELAIWGNGHEIERTGGNGPLKYHRKIVLDVPPNYVQVIVIHVTGVTNALAYVDPVITPHPDNPEVEVTVHGGLDPSPPRLGLWSPEELSDIGVDVASLQEFGLLDSPSSIDFVSPAPETTRKAGARIRTRFRLVDGAGALVPDAVARNLSRACRVQVGLDAPRKCARYSAGKHLFRSPVKIPKSTSPGAHQIAVQVLDADGVVDQSAAAAISVRRRPMGAR